MAAIYLMQPGAGTRVRTWTPRAGHFTASASRTARRSRIADYFTVREGAQVVYRPTVHYAYHPCDSAVMSIHELVGRNYVQQERQRILMDDITGGIDELGVLLAGHKKNAYWYGSQLSIEEARKLAPYNNATSLQVTAAVLSGVVWAMENPELRHRRAGRDGFPAQPGDLRAVPRARRRGLHRLDAVARARAAVPRGPRQDRSVAVQERPGAFGSHVTGRDVSLVTSWRRP